MSDAAVAAIKYAIHNDGSDIFLRLWFEGEFDAIRREWDDVPDEVFIGADPLMPMQEPEPESLGEILSALNTGHKLVEKYDELRKAAEALLEKIERYRDLTHLIILHEAENLSAALEENESY